MESVEVKRCLVNNTHSNLFRIIWLICEPHWNWRNDTLPLSFHKWAKYKWIPYRSYVMKHFYTEIQNQQWKHWNNKKSLFKVLKKTPERHQWSLSCVFIVNFEQFSHIVLMPLLLTLFIYLYINFILIWRKS